jgi:hypothetical protein
MLVMGSIKGELMKLPVNIFKLLKLKKSCHYICKQEKEYALIFSKKYRCICPEIRKVEGSRKIDELIWRLVGTAHEILKMEKELNNYYPEFASFLNYLVVTYPGLKERK